MARKSKRIVKSFEDGSFRRADGSGGGGSVRGPGGTLRRKPDALNAVGVHPRGQVKDPALDIVLGKVSPRNRSRRKINTYAVGKILGKRTRK